MVEQTGPSGGTLRRGTAVGNFTIEWPEGADRQRLVGGPARALDTEPVLGMPIATGHFTAWFTADSQPSRYRTVLAPDGGYPVEMFADINNYSAGMTTVHSASRGFEVTVSQNTVRQ